ncbi:MAG: enoyl-[acyl-carrier protein] reductase I [Planctomycetota bacterium]
MRGATANMDTFLKGKTGVVLGVANKRSLAWACAKSMADAGMRVAFTYLGDRLEKTVRELAAEIPNSLVLPCDVTKPEQVTQLFETLKEEFGYLDTVLHAIAFAKREELQGDFYNTTKEGYMLAHEVSAYSLTEITRAALPLMKGREGSIVTLSYIGADRVVPGYNVMGIAKAALEASVRYLAADLGPIGIRVNAISAGPVRTLSASGVKDFGKRIEEVAARTAMRRNVTAEEVGDACLFLAGPHSRGITGTVLFVDAGFHIMG